MLALYTNLIYDPIYNTLVLFYNIVPIKDFGIALILTTLLLRFFLYPLSRKQISSQKTLQDLQPKIKEIQSRYAKKKSKPRQ
jgi:YidC/Oxa1 family membrane protein insertase